MSDSEQLEAEWDGVFELSPSFQQIGTYANSVRPTRLRSFPLVPEPYEKLSGSRQCVFLGGNRMAEKWCKFCPNLDIPRYMATLSAEEQAQLNTRASKLQRHVVLNTSEKVSESTWETDIRSDVFDRIRDDPQLRVDKRPYYYQVKYKEPADSDNPLKWRTPDLTLGLATYSSNAVEHEEKTPSTDAPGWSVSRGAHWSLCKDRLRTQVECPETGLIVDGKWGEVDLVFPWAVYEAKKRSTSYEDAEDQVFHAANVYLGMLDDLARSPDDPTKFQTSESDRYQMFAFSSSGAYWLVYAVYPFLGGCQVETLWEGNVCERPRAFDFICLVDQIHRFAITQHRDFVIRHLEPWIGKAEEYERNRIQPALDISFEDDSGFWALTDLETSEGRIPRWSVLKFLSQNLIAKKRAKSRLANKTRKGKEKKRHGSQELHAATTQTNEIEGEDANEMSWSPAEA